MNAPAPGIFDLLQRQLLDLGREIVEVSQWQAIKSNDGQIILDFLVAVDAQWESPDDVLFGRIQLLLRWAFRHEFCQRVLRNLQCRFSLLLLRLQSHLKWTFQCQRIEIAVCAVGVTAFLAYFLIEPGSKPPSTEHLVAQE